MQLIMDKWRNTCGYISVEIVIIVAIILIGGTIGVSKYSAKGKETTNKTTTKVEQTVAFAGEIPSGSGKNDGSGTNNSTNNTEIKTDGINLLKDNIGLLVSDFTSSKKSVGKIIVIDNGPMNAYTSKAIDTSKIKTYDDFQIGNKYIFSGEIKTKNLNKEGLQCYFDLRSNYNLAGNDFAAFNIPANQNDEWLEFKKVLTVTKSSTMHLISITTDGHVEQSTADYKGVEIEYKDFKLEKIIS